MLPELANEFEEEWEYEYGADPAVAARELEQELETLEAQFEIGRQAEDGMQRQTAGTVRIITHAPRQSTWAEAGVSTPTTARFRPAAGDALDAILAATAAAEGGYDTVNMYDKGILSWGIMQWTAHFGSLQRVLAFIKDRLAQRGQLGLWSRLFPDLDARRIGGEYQLIHRGTPVIGIPQLRQLLRGSPARGQYDQAIIRRWARVFALAGRHPVVQQLQREYARAEVVRALNINLRLKFGPKYRRVRDYVGGNLKATALFFGMWTNNPTYTYKHLRLAIDRLAARYRTHDIARWPAGWQALLAAEFERVLRASRVGYWGDAKARAAGRTSRTQKVISRLQQLNGVQR
jgi:hypothetical protein